MQVIGLLGGIASGKSLVANALVDLGAAVLDADQAGHAVLRLDAVKDAVLQRFGNDVFDASGEIRRPALAAIVFERSAQGHQALADLEAITHPLIRERLTKQLNLFRQQGFAVVVLDAPVMLKAGWDQLCDLLVFVDAPWEARLQRAEQRGWNAQELLAREAAQESLQEKQALADVTIDNSSSVDATRDQVNRLWQRVRRSAAQSS